LGFQKHFSFVKAVSWCFHAAVQKTGMVRDANIDLSTQNYVTKFF